MLALSIQQPWPWAMFNLDKDIENRGWYTNVRGRVLIHAGKRLDRDGFYNIEDICGRTPPHDLPTGGIVGAVSIVDCVNQHDSKWFFGTWGFVLRDPRPLPFLLYRGSLGFFRGQLSRCARAFEEPRCQRPTAAAQKKQRKVKLCVKR
jgi:hypothetical protein